MQKNSKLKDRQKGAEMKRKELRKILIPMLALTMALPTPVLAADGGGAAAGGQTADQAVSQQAEQPSVQTSVQPEGQQPETPAAYEQRTGYTLPEGWQYVLDENGYVTLKDDGTPVLQEIPAEPEVTPGPGESGGETDTPGQPEEGTDQPGESGEGTDTPGQQPGEGTEVPGGSDETVGETPGGIEDPSTTQEEPGKTADAPVAAPAAEQPDGTAEGTTEGAAPASTNEQLVAAQTIVELPVIVEDFRFWTVARKYGFAREDLEIKEKMDDSSRSIGSLAAEGVCYILKEDTETGWMYVESGRVRGFVKAEPVMTGEEAQSLLEQYQEEAKALAEESGEEYTGIGKVAEEAAELVPWQENEAFTWLRATVNQTVIEKEYALCNVDKLNIREGKGTDSRIVGTLSKGALCYILADREQEWIYIESGDVRGFVKSEYIDFGDAVKTEVEEKGEEAFAAAEQLIAPEDNRACYYTMTSVKSGVPGGEIRESLLEFASQFIGNPYVWGGTSLTDGADCSGFVQSIYREYGYDLPRTSAEQSQYGTKIPVEDAQPGDLIFYAKDGVVYHVVIYAGDGKTIEAMSTDRGIVQGNVIASDAVWATRILEDTVYVQGSGDIAEVNAEPAMYGEDLGEFRLTYYCSCEICCDVETGITATGTPVIEGRTIAVDPSVIPYGTQVIINGHIFTAEDCGGAIKGNRIDIYVSDHDRANALGVNTTEVYLLK